MDRNPDLADFYNENDEFTVSNKQRNAYQAGREGLEDWEQAVLDSNAVLYQLDFSNLGGLVMPIILKIDYEDGSSEELRLPAEIWRRSPKQVSKLLLRDKVIASVTVDPHWETADVDVNNNHYPRRIPESRLDLFKRDPSRNLMLDMTEKLKTGAAEGTDG